MSWADVSKMKPRELARERDALRSVYGSDPPAAVAVRIGELQAELGDRHREYLERQSERAR